MKKSTAFRLFLKAVFFYAFAWFLTVISEKFFKTADLTRSRGYPIEGRWERRSDLPKFFSKTVSFAPLPRLPDRGAEFSGSKADGGSAPSKQNIKA